MHDAPARFRWVVLAISFMAQSSNAVAALAVAPLAPIFQPELGLTKAQVGFFSAAGFAGALGVLLIAGSLTDRFGVRRMMSLGQLVSGAGILAMASAGGFVQAVTVMMVAGLGRGMTAPGVTKSVVDWFPPVGRATAVAVNQTAIPVAGILTAATLPPLALVVGWRGAAATVGGVILIGAVATALFYRDRKLPDHALHRRGVGSNLGEVLRNRWLWAIAGVGPLFAGVQFSLTTYLALYYNEVILVPMFSDERTRIVAAGGYLAVSHVGSALARIGWGMVGDRLFPGRRVWLLAVAGILAALASLGMSALRPDGTGIMAFFAAFICGALMMGTQGLYMLVAAETAGVRHAGSGVGFCMTGTQLGFVAVPTIFGLTLDAAGSYVPAWMLLAGLAAVGALATAVLAGKSGTQGLDK